jgi:hypothetical protein
MTFALVRPAGFTDGTRFFDHELNQIQEDLPFALDTRGGTYTQTSPIVFDGDTWELPETTFSGDVTIPTGITLVVPGSADFDGPEDHAGTCTYNGVVTSTGTFRSYGTTIIGNASTDSLQVEATAGFGSYVGFAGAVDVSGLFRAQDDSVLLGAVIVGDVSSESDSLNVYSHATTFHRNVTFSMTVSMTENLSVHGSTQLGDAVGDTVTAAGGITAGAGCSLPGRFLIMTDANQTPEWSTTNCIHVPSGVLSTTRTITPGTTGVPTGAAFEVSTADASHSVTIGSVELRATSGYAKFAKFRFSGSTWVCVLTVSA